MTRSSLEVVLSPAEFPALARRDLSRSVCVVFDILRATTSMITALASGARAIVPVAEIAEAVVLRRQQPEILLAGERDGLRIRASQTGAMDFDLGNSPREFTPAAVADRTIVMTTTNGTRALRACAGAEAVLAAAFLNLGATTEWLRQRNPASVILVCGGTYEEPAFEDILAAGAVCQQLWSSHAGGEVSDGAEVARRLYAMMEGDLLGAMQSARNGRRLLGMPELRDDVAFCVQRDTVSFVAGQGADGAIRRL